MKTKDYIRSLTEEQIAQVYCEINSWRCPKILKYRMPITYILTRKGQAIRKGSLANLLHKHLLSPLMKFCEALIGERAVSKYWNTKHQDNMTDEQFDEWWNDKDGHFKKQKENYENKTQKSSQAGKA